MTAYESASIESRVFGRPVDAETVERLLSMLEGRHREMLTLTLQGYTPAEISARLHCTERTVCRVLERAKEWLEAAVEALRTRFAAAGYSIPAEVRFTIGWPKRAAGCGAEPVVRRNSTTRRRRSA